MIKLSLERKNEVLLMTVPPLEGLPELEYALSSGSVGGVDFWDKISLTEQSVLELPRMVWKRILSRVRYEHDSRVALDVARKQGLNLRAQGAFQKFFETFEAPQDRKLAFILDGVEYADVRKMPREAGFDLDLGMFDLSQPVLRVSDPCYEKDTWCAFTVDAVPGQWRASATFEDDDVRGYCVSRLAIAHESLEGPLEFSKFDQTPAGNAGVDSGQCGFYDDAKYPSDKAEFEYEDGRFYGDICSALSVTYDYGDAEYPASVIPAGFGAASQTFYGDGGYPCRVMRNKEGLVVAAYLWYAPYADPFFPDDCDREEGAEEGDAA